MWTAPKVALLLKQPGLAKGQMYKSPAKPVFTSPRQLASMEKSGDGK